LEHGQNELQASFGLQKFEGCSGLSVNAVFWWAVIDLAKTAPACPVVSVARETLASGATRIPLSEESMTAGLVPA
jgi:hypothetical protein